MTSWNEPTLEPLSWKKKHVSLLGKQVRVTLDDSGEHIITGKLLGFGEDGEFEVQDNMGVVHYCWPMLHVEEIDVA